MTFLIPDSRTWPVLLFSLPFFLISAYLMWLDRQAKPLSHAPLRSRLTGRQTARRLLSAYGLSGVTFGQSDPDGQNSYLHAGKKIRLQDDISGRATIRSAAVAAHECAHALQDRDGPFLYRFRASRLYRVFLGVLIVFGYLLYGLSLLWQAMPLFLAETGLLLLSDIIYHTATLWTEADASRRAIRMLRKTGVIAEDEVLPARKALRPGLMSYIWDASLYVSSLLIFAWCGYVVLLKFWG
jgi:Zn-dependent membrane protease YugP